MIAISDVEQVGIQESYAVIVAHLLNLFVYPAAFIIYFPFWCYFCREGTFLAS